MRINAEFDQPVLLKPEDREWIRSPAAGVERQMLDRIGDEVARATSIVRYIPGSTFDAHEHALGEEFLVLEGVFADEHGAYPAGTYVRNPPGTAHRPDVPDGCVILVKLRQFDLADLTPVVENLNLDDGYEAIDEGVESRRLHQYGSEVVSALRVAPGGRLRKTVPGGAEVYVISGRGGLTPQGSLTEGAWLRLPPGAELDFTVGDEPTHVWMKEGHLPPSDGVDGNA